jgi:hypothetical protein
MEYSMHHISDSYFFLMYSLFQRLCLFHASHPISSATSLQSNSSDGFPMSEPVDLEFVRNYGNTSLFRTV